MWYHGIDLTRTSRFTRLVKTRFPNKILNPKELVEFRSAHDPARFLATRWALKEAAFKALPHRIDFKDIHTWKQLKKPMIHIPGYHSSCSLSHEGDLVMASVVLWSIWCALYLYRSTWRVFIAIWCALYLYRSTWRVFIAVWCAFYLYRSTWRVFIAVWCAWNINVIKNIGGAWHVSVGISI